MKDNPQNNPRTQPQRPPADPPAWFSLPSDVRPAARRSFWIVAALALVLAVALPPLVRRMILYRQFRLPESYVWRAIHALEDGDEEEARRHVDRVLATTIENSFEGGALTYRAPYYGELSRLLYEHGWKPEGAAIAYKAHRHYHRVKRALEYQPPWIGLALDYREDDALSFLEVFEMMASHSLVSCKEIFGDDRVLADSLKQYGNLRSFYYDKEPEFAARVAARARIDSTMPELVVAMESLRVRVLLKDGQARLAASIARDLARAHPDRLDVAALAAVTQGLGDPRTYVDSLDEKSPFKVVDFNSFRAVPGEYKTAPMKFGEERPPKLSPEGEATFLRKGTAELSFSVDRPVSMGYLLASGTDFLDVYPIVLWSVDGGPTRPVYLDLPNDSLFVIPLRLDPGEHRIRFEFLNDYAARIDGVLHDRNAVLSRLVLQYEGE